MKKKKGKINSTESFISSAKEIHGDNYDYSKTVYVKISEKVIVVCKKHGDFFVTPGNHIYNKQGCRQCYIDRKHSNLETFITKAREIHGDKYDYSKSIYVKAHSKLIVICPEHGEFTIDPHHHKLGVGCYHCGREKIVASRQYDQETFITKARAVHGDLYDYSKVVYDKSNIKVILVCPVHGEFSIRPADHINQKQGCKKCGHETLSEKFRSNTEEFISKAKQIHEDIYDYSKVNYIKASIKVTINCPEHGDFLVRPSSHLTGSGCPICSSSKGEKFISKILKENNINFIREFRLPEILNVKYRYDFWLPDHNLLIEFHGGQHYFPVEYFGGEESFKKTRERDIFKKILAKETRRNLVIFNYKQFRNPRYLKQLILKVLNKYKI